MPKRRGKNIDESITDRIVRVMDGWSGKFGWGLLVAKLNEKEGLDYTRQTLSNHPRIQEAYDLTKARLSEAPKVQQKQKLSECESEALIQRLERLQAENARLELENDRLLEQFQIWAYNAHLKGLTKEYLSTPLPRVDRERTKL